VLFKILICKEARAALAGTHSAENGCAIDFWPLPFLSMIGNILRQRKVLILQYNLNEFGVHCPNRVLPSLYFGFAFFSQSVEDSLLQKVIDSWFSLVSALYQP
jgi:hypothetical protein